MVERLNSGKSSKFGVAGSRFMVLMQRSVTVLLFYGIDMRCCSWLQEKVFLITSM